MAAPPRRFKDLGKVVDGRIRKSWPFAAFGGPIETKNMRAKGLRNPGDLCHRNAMLQCLLHTPEFFRYLQCEERCSTPGDGCVFCALRNLALRYWTTKRDKFPQSAVTMVNTAMEKHPVLHPSDRTNVYGFLRSTANSPNNMAAAGQQDAHEYFLGVVNMLKYINNDMVHGVENVAVDSLFKLETKISWKCEDCGKRYSRREGDIGIQLAIPSTKAHQTTLQACLSRHYANETVEGVRCDSQACNGKARDRTREFKIVGAPEILVIQLKRAWMNLYTGTTRKMLDRVDMGERLDLSPWSNGVLTYQLNGIVAHRGDSLKSGHYIAMVRSPNGVDFARCDDTHIGDHPREKAAILEEPKTKEWQSYVLVYQKIGGKMAKCI